MTANPYPSGWQFSNPLGSTNAVTVFLDPAAIVWDWRQTNVYGYLGQVLTIPNVVAGTPFGVQCLFADIGGSGCAAASNAVVLTVQS